MHIYLVGGAVRDALLGLAIQDRDWVVVGATPQTMIDLGFTPVGKDFPVFLHPQTHEEFALARTERKSAPGYRGFVVHADADVTLEQDLSRRDLSINAMAVAAEHALVNGELRVHIPTEPAQWQAHNLLQDPFGGLPDLKQGTLRHVSEAFTEDPVRILRLARLAARFDSFSAAPTTMALMQSMVRSGEVDHLVAERVWQELSKGLMAPKPSRMFKILRQCQALKRLLPELERLHGVHQSPEEGTESDAWEQLMLVMDTCAELHVPLTVRLACLFHDLDRDSGPDAMRPNPTDHEARGHLLQTVCQRLRVPSECKALAALMAREQQQIHRSISLNAAALMELLERCDAFRQTQRFADLIQACECNARGRFDFYDTAYAQGERLLGMLAAAQAVNTKRLIADAAASGVHGKDLGTLIQQTRTAAIQDWLGLNPSAVR